MSGKAVPFREALEFYEAPPRWRRSLPTISWPYAEYLLHGGNGDVVLCERGIKTFDNSLRNTLDLAAVALVKEMTHLPVIVDPSHATGKRSLIAKCAKAAIAIGADGVVVEVHPAPDKALSDGARSLTFELFGEMMEELRTPIRRLRAAMSMAI